MNDSFANVFCVPPNSRNADWRNTAVSWSFMIMRSFVNVLIRSRVSIASDEDQHSMSVQRC